MKKSMLLCLLALALLSIGAQAAIITNPGFEDPAGVDGPAAGWTDTSLVFGYNRCDATCGGVGPHSGTYWAWLGGISTSETGSISQSVTIPVGGSAVLSYYLWNSSTTIPGAGTMTVTIDGNPLLTLLSDAPAIGGYQFTSHDISSYADGGSHTIAFAMTKGVTPNSWNVHIDDVDLVVRQAEVPEPSTFLLGGSALLGLAFLRRRR
ncbi:MAG: PEP-CTERM sorting domain-containing protein [Acidobacteria bacterium]|nr:PEP-CTERM sorting domain-containing protein [Acidobacteriota bacterium]